MSLVFADKVGLISLWDTTDPLHLQAESCVAELHDASLCTTNFVLLECGNKAARRPYRGRVNELRMQLEKSGMLFVPTEADWQRAWECYAQGQAGNAGIVDQISFVVMRRLNITRAFTHDRHFKAAGFETLF